MGGPSAAKYLAQAPDGSLYVGSIAPNTAHELSEIAVVTRLAP